MNKRKVPDQDIPIIGRHIPWNLVEQEFLLVVDFVPFARVVAGQVEAASRGLPYGLLRVECAVLETDADLPIIHRHDFINIWSMYEARGVRKDEEVLVVYKPYFSGLLRYLLGLLQPTMPRLHVFVYRKGSFDAIQQGKEPTPLEERRPSVRAAARGYEDPNVHQQFYERLKKLRSRTEQEDW